MTQLQREEGGVGGSKECIKTIRKHWAQSFVSSNFFLQWTKSQLTVLAYYALYTQLVLLFGHKEGTGQTSIIIQRKHLGKNYIILSLRVSKALASPISHPAGPKARWFKNKNAEMRLKKPDVKCNRRIWSGSGLSGITIFVQKNINPLTPNTENAK